MTLSALRSFARLCAGQPSHKLALLRAPPPLSRFALKGERGPWIFRRVQVADSKTELRKRAREKRRGMFFAGFADALAMHVDALDVQPGMVVGGYMALPDEADPAMLLAALVARGCTVAFPRVTGKGQPLAFCAIPKGAALIEGAYGILEPQIHWPTVTPDLLLVPLLAFDGAGYRLGQGGGFYDRTLAQLQGRRGEVRAVGIAYAGQQVDFVPHDAHDCPLDAVLTEQGLKVFP